jgi:hypothetical protein
LRTNPAAGKQHAGGFGDRPGRVGKVEQRVGEDDRVGGPVGEREGVRVSEDGRRAAAGAGDVQHPG